MTRVLAAIAAILLGPSAASAQVVGPCGDRVDVTQIVEPWETRTRSFAENAIRIFEVYVDPHVAQGAFLGVLHPDPRDDGIATNRACTTVMSERTSNGMVAEVYVEDATASYDPARGLTLSVPVRILGGDSDTRDEFVFTVNQATGEVLPLAD
ncbi:hypothetical protein [Histidinibacterium aquaticum]|uniref:Uncharacterized protein n=1 Tax=Histidinibacterium aquaticum TaxID=2613962 RepID=A0A5J5GPL1_9RHOB|nr:hypothetical protein [Histidinibacterium aquaticum]KAA9009995.1 hypothetical protein F3S47_01665 [Histidinibacterium aquaticum]